MKPRRVLVISLLFNMLLSGVLAGQFFHGWLGKESHSFTDWLKETGLSAEQQARIQEGLNSAREQNTAEREESKRLRQQILDVLTAPEFNAEAYRDLSERMLNLRQQSRSNMVSKIGDMAQTLSPEERGALAHVIRRYAKERDRCRNNTPAKP
jgi:uncharacterized membrane protein